MTTATNNACGCGCNTMTLVTQAAEPCGCGCECCSAAPASTAEEIAELRRLRESVERRLADLESAG